MYVSHLTAASLFLLAAAIAYALKAMIGCAFGAFSTSGKPVAGRIAGPGAICGASVAEGVQGYILLVR